MSISVMSSCGARLFSYIYSNSVEKRRNIYYYYLSGVPPGWAGLYPTGGSAASIAEPITRAEGKGDGGSTTSGLSGPPSTGLSLLEQVVEGGHRISVLVSVSGLSGEDGGDSGNGIAGAEEELSFVLFISGLWIVWVCA